MPDAFDHDKQRAGRLGAAARRKQRGEYAQAPPVTSEETLTQWRIDRERALAAAMNTACPMCGWSHGTNPANCGECAEVHAR